MSGAPTDRGAWPCRQGDPLTTESHDVYLSRWAIAWPLSSIRSTGLLRTFDQIRWMARDADPGMHLPHMALM